MGCYGIGFEISVEATYPIDEGSMLINANNFPYKCALKIFQVL